MVVACMHCELLLLVHLDDCMGRMLAVIKGETSTNSRNEENNFVLLAFWFANL
jgi:hypothetical protein